MLLQEDFKHLRDKPNNKLQLFPNKIVKQQNVFQCFNEYEKGYLAYFKALLNEFISYFTMHGVDRIFEKNLNKFKRLTWIVGFFVCLCVFCYVSFQVGYIYYEKPLVTVISVTRYPIFRIPFPEITICNRNRFNWQRLGLAKKVFLRPEHQLIPKYENIFTEVVNAYDTLSFGKFYKFENLTRIPPGLLQDLNYINFQLVSEFMAWRCHEIFSICEWRDDLYDCCEIFLLRNSQLGSCLAFNTIESQEGLDKQKLDPYWPWRAKDRGMYNGLGVRIHLNENHHSPKGNNRKGILVMLAEPNVWFNTPIEVDTHTRTSISIKATLHKFSNYTRIISSKVRQCLFEDELQNEHYKSLPNRAYMVENCRSQCQLEYILKFCNCSFTLFYPPVPYRPCKLVDYPCLYYHNEKFQYLEQSAQSDQASNQIDDSMECTCFFNCRSLTYYPKITTAYRRNVDLDFNNSYIDLDVFFQREFLMVFLTTVLYTLADLMASFGGLAGLCLGCSLLSLMEIVYFFIVDIPCKSLLYYKIKQGSTLHWRRHRAKVDIMENVLSN